MTKTTILNHSVTMDDMSVDDEFITASEFEDATRTTVRTLGKNFNCDVVFAGEGAKTNGKVVVLPAQAPDKLMTKKQYAVGQGYANHETMHNLCTDMDGLAPTMERLKKSGKKLAMAYANAIEDIRIERAGATLYPGMPSQISATADYAAKKFIDDYLPSSPDIVKDVKRIGPLALTWVGRQRMGYESPYIKKCIDSLDPAVLEQVNKWADLVYKLPTGATGPGEFDQKESYRGSHEAVKYAEMLAREIEDVEEEDEDEKDEANPERGAGAGAGDVDSEPLDPNFDALVRDVMAEGSDAKSYRPITTALDLIATKDNPAKSVRARLCKANGEQLYLSMLSALGSRTATMKRKLERALTTAAEADYVSGQRAGRLDIRRHATNIMKGRENVYRRKLEGVEIDTAVMILCDMSGSMGGEKMKLSAQTCIALAECFEKTGVHLEIIGFQNSTNADAFDKKVVEIYNNALKGVSEAKDKGTSTGIFHRIEPLNTWIFKSFDESIRECRQQLGSMSESAGGNNSDGDALLIAAKRLLRKQAKKHILMVLSDGQPAYRVLDGNTFDYTKQCANYITNKLKINTVGIGIMDTSVQKFYKNWAVVNDLSDLDKAVMDNIARMILGENFKVDNGDVSGAAANFKGMRSRA